MTPRSRSGHPCSESSDTIKGFNMPALVTGSRRLEFLQNQRSQLVDEVSTITDRVADEKRDLTDAEENTLRDRKSRLEKLEDDIAVEVDLAERSARYEEMAGRIAPRPSEGHTGTSQRQAPVPAIPTYETPGHYLRDFLIRSKDTAARERFDAYLRAAPHQTTVDNPGIIPEPIVGPVLGQYVGVRPAFNAATSRPMPASGIKFTRPIITQHLTVGKQAAEKTALPGGLMTISDIEVTKATYGGYVNLSFQNRDWSDPAILNLLISDLAAQYMRQVGSAFATYLETTVTATTPVTDVNDPADWLTALFTASATIYGAVNSMPNTLWVSPDVWAFLGSMVDTTGRPLFPSIGPMNALGRIGPQSLTGDIATFNLVVDAYFPPKTAIVGDATYVETYEQIGGQVQAVEPTLLGTNIAYYGYAAWAVLDPDAFVQLAAPIPPPLAAEPEGTNGGTTTGTYSGVKVEG